VSELLGGRFPQKLAPELNPIEQRKLWGSGFPPQRFLRQVWQYLKRRLRWSLPHTLDQLRQQLRERLEALTFDVVRSITGRRSILASLSLAGL